MRGVVAVVGATGFVGTAVTSALRAAGHEVRRVRAARLRESSFDVREVCDHARTRPELDTLSGELAGCSAVVNAAGVADAGGGDWPVIAGANGLLPGVIALAAARAEVHRVVHVSSMAVQGRIAVLDESLNYDSFSAYSRSKQLGEQVILNLDPDGRVLILRPGSVHGAGRRVTSTLTHFARSRLSSVAGTGEQPSPQSLVANVAGAIVLLVEADDAPRVVLQPWEGVTTGSLLRRLGGREPHHVPAAAARAALGPLRAAGAASPAAQAWARRLELLWFGQLQAQGYLDRIGFQPQHGDAAWSTLAKAV